MRRKCYENCKHTLNVVPFPMLYYTAGIFLFDKETLVDKRGPTTFNWGWAGRDGC